MICRMMPSLPNCDEQYNMYVPERGLLGSYKSHWTLYVDPITSLILTALILTTTLKLLKGKLQ